MADNKRSSTYPYVRSTVNGPFEHVGSMIGFLGGIYLGWTFGGEAVEYLTNSSNRGILEEIVTNYQLLSKVGITLSIADLCSKGLQGTGYVLDKIFDTYKPYKKD